MDKKPKCREPTMKRNRSESKANSIAATNHFEFKVPNVKVSKRRSAKRCSEKLKENQDDDLNEIERSVSKKSTKTNNSSSKNFSSQDSPYLVKYQPKNKNDLCIEKKKLTALEDWFYSIYVNKEISQGRILLLYGPTGCGKTSSVLCLAKHFDVKIYEFEEKSQTNNFMLEECQITQHVGKQLDQIQSFVTSANSSLSKKDREKRKAIIFKDLPSTFLSKTEEFHEFLRNYLKLFRKSAPIIIIITINDKMNLNLFKKIFPTELYCELSIHSIEILGVGKKQMRIILNRINVSGRASKQDIDMLIESSNGDLRSAINALEFLLETDKNDSFEIQTNKSNNIIAIKDTSPAFFHMLGKILYCKREGDENFSKKRSNDESKIFNFDLNESRRKLKESPEELVEHIDSNGETLSLFIHESYLNFVDNDFNNAANIIMNLSFIDSHFSSLCTKIDNWEYNEFDNYMKLLAVRGTMYNLNSKFERVKTNKQFKAFTKPKYYSILRDEAAFRNKINERLKIKNNEFRTRDEMMEIMFYKDKNLFSKLLLNFQVVEI